MSFFSRLCIISAATYACFNMAAAGHAAPGKASRHTADADKFSFVLYGDTRSHAFAHRSIISDIVALHPEFALQSGDLVSDGHSKRQWDEFDQITEPLRSAGIADYPSRGNHDLGPYYLRYVPAHDSGDGYYYAFTRHHNRFIIIDNFEDESPGSSQYEWLESELSKAEKNAVNTFVMFHEAPFSVGPHGSILESQRYLHPLFVKHHVRAVFCGHDHLYYRTLRDGIHYFITGGGGAPLYTADNRAAAVPGDVYATAHHIIRFDVDGKHVTATVIAHLMQHPGDERVDPAFTLSYTPFDVVGVTAQGSHVLMNVSTPGTKVIDQVSFGS